MSARRTPNAELLHAAAQRARGKPERLCPTARTLDHPPRAFERLLDVASLDFFESEGLGAIRHQLRRLASSIGRGGDRLREQLWRDLELRATGEDDGALDHIRELAHVSGPGIGE